MIKYNLHFSAEHKIICELSGNTYKVYCTLRLCRPLNSYITNPMTYAQLATYSGVNKGRIQNHINDLIELDLIDKINSDEHKYGYHQFYLKLAEQLRLELAAEKVAKDDGTDKNNTPESKIEVPNQDEIDSDDRDNIVF